MKSISKHIHMCVFHTPGEPPNMAKGGTTVSGGNTVLSRILQQSFSIHERDWRGRREVGLEERGREEREGGREGRERERERGRGREGERERVSICFIS